VRFLRSYIFNKLRRMSKRVSFDSRRRHHSFSRIFKGILTVPNENSVRRTGSSMENRDVSGLRSRL